MGGCDQSQVKIKFKKFKKVKSVPKDVPKSHNDDRLCHTLTLGARGPGNQQKHLEYIAGSG